MEDLTSVKACNVLKDNRLQVISKEEIKINLGRSPGDGDCLMMRMYFEIAKEDHAPDLSGLDFDFGVVF